MSFHHNLCYPMIYITWNWTDFVTPPPLLRQRIAIFAVAEGWLSADLSCSWKIRYLICCCVSRTNAIVFCNWYTYMCMWISLLIFRDKIVWNCNFVSLLHHPFWLQLVLACLGHLFLIFEITSLAKDHWWGFSTRNAHIVHILKLNPI